MSGAGRPRLGATRVGFKVPEGQVEGEEASMAVVSGPEVGGESLKGCGKCLLDGCSVLSPDLKDLAHMLLIIIRQSTAWDFAGVFWLSFGGSRLDNASALDRGRFGGSEGKRRLKLRLQ
ncbi:hypothetical protein ISCGN_016521 [Ixodes scapularis]